ncbi:MAG: hypothetical protein ACD_71C00072G0001, partial [uncultured bacterium (gcode 4)]
MSFRNERNLYKRKCDATNKDIISNISPDKKYKIYHQDYWWSDKWDAIDYGQEFDFGRSFFKQFDELLKAVPQMWLLVAQNINSEYVNYSANTKDSYLIFASSQNENCMYSRWIMNCKNLVDANNCSNCENCYECVDCINISSSKYCIWCVDSNNCFASYDLMWCNNCISCSLLRNKSYCIDNVQYSREDFMKKKQEIKINSDLLKKTIQKWIHRSQYKLNTENCTWEYITNSKNIFAWFEVENCENCKYITNALNLRNSQDIDFQAFDDELCYEVLWIENTYNTLFSYWILEAKNVILSFTCFGWNPNLFGCIGLRNKSYCILNKQYTKEEYETLVPKIIEHMKKTGEWGEFFPSSMSPFGYNETVAQEYFPLSKEVATMNNVFNWSDYEALFPVVAKIIPASKLPDNIKDIPDDILNWAIECEVTGKPFRIIRQELDFYRKHNLPIPRRHPDQRHLDRMAFRNPRKLYERKCDKCETEMMTTYSPERPERVYCE